MILGVAVMSFSVVGVVVVEGEEAVTIAVVVGRKQEGGKGSEEWWG